MKKNNLLKVLTISFLIFVVLSWVIPAGSLANGSFMKGDVAPLGILDLVSVPLSTFANYCGYGILILVIGGFYGVLEKTGILSRVVEKMSKKYENKKTLFTVLTIVMFTLLTSLTGNSYVLLVLVPLFAAVLLKLGYDKVSTLAATVGSILVGNMACTYGFNVNGYINYYLGIDNMNNQIVTKIILLVLLTVLLVMFVLKHNAKTVKVEKTGKETKEEKKEEVVVKVENKETKKVSKKAPAAAKKSSSTAKKKSTKKTTASKKSGKKNTAAFAKKDDVKVIKNKREKSIWPLVIIWTFVVIFLLVATYNWRYSFNIEVFEELYESINSFTVKDFPIFKNLIGAINPLGYWAVNEISMILVLASFLIGWIYSVKCSDIVEAFGNGAKKVVSTAFYVVLANVIVSALIAMQNSGNVFFTITDNVIGWTKDFNMFTTGLVSFIGGFFFNDMPYLVSSISATLTTKITDSTLYPLIGLVMQTMHGLAMMMLPTSVILVAGLSYFEVSFKDWMKYIWKFLIQIFVVALIVCFIVAMCI